MVNLNYTNLPDNSLLCKKHVENRIQEVQDNVASQLQKITENNNTGWRILGVNPDHYGDIGNHGIDLSFSTVNSSTHGATGNFAFAAGQNTTAAGNFSVALGKGGSATGINSLTLGTSGISHGSYSISIGYEVTANGNYSQAFGYKTEANGDYSHSEGFNTTASGSTSHAEGYGTKASGDFSFAANNITEASGWASFAIGTSTKAVEDSSFASGNNTQALGTKSFATGYNTKAEGENSFVANQDNISEGLNSTAFGKSTYAKGENSFVIGRLNIGTDENNYFEIGAGFYDQNGAHKRNAFEVNKNGTLTAPLLSITRINNGSNRVLITKEFLNTTISSTEFGELIKVTEGNKTGYRLRDSNPDNHGDIGENAVDLSYSDEQSNVHGALGNNSFAVGYLVNTFGENSVAMNYATYADGNESVALNHCTKAHGKYSLAVGSDTLANNDNSFACGYFNKGSSDNTIVEVGIGIDENNRKNALEIYSDGRIVAPEESISIIDDTADNLDKRTLITKEYLQQHLNATEVVPYNFIAQANQKDFIIHNKSNVSVRVFSDGLYVQNTEYSVNDDQSNNQVTIHFNVGRQQNEPVTIEIYSNASPLNEVDFAAQDGQTDFIIQNHVFAVASVYIEGILISSNRYTLTNDGTNTTLHLNESAEENDWIHISF